MSSSVKRANEQRTGELDVALGAVATNTRLKSEVWEEIVLRPAGAPLQLLAALAADARSATTAVLLSTFALTSPILHRESNVVLPTTTWSSSQRRRRRITIARAREIALQSLVHAENLRRFAAETEATRLNALELPE